MNKKKHDRAMRWIAGQLNRDAARALGTVVAGGRAEILPDDTPFTAFLYRTAMEAKDHVEFQDRLHTASSELYFTIGEQEKDRTWRYIITGEGCMALPVHTKMPWSDFREYVRKMSVPKGKACKRVFRWGTLEFVEPVVHCVSDYVESSPALIGMR
jgi:hypothetical protein